MLRVYQDSGLPELIGECVAVPPDMLRSHTEYIMGGQHAVGFEKPEGIPEIPVGAAISMVTIDKGKVKDLFVFNKEGIACPIECLNPGNFIFRQYLSPATGVIGDLLDSTLWVPQQHTDSARPTTRTDLQDPGGF